MSATKLTNNDRKSIIDDLITNTDWTEEDRNTLQGLSDDQLKRIVADAIIANGDDGDDDDMDDEDFELDDELDGEMDNAEDDEEDEVPVANRRRMTTNEFPPKKKKKMKSKDDEEAEPACNSVEEYLSKAPPGIREPLKALCANVRSQRRDIIKSLIANRGCPFDKDELRGMDLPALQKLAKLAGLNSQVTFNGAQGEFSLTDNDEVDEAPPPRFTLDFEKKTA